MSEDQRPSDNNCRCGGGAVTEHRANVCGYGGRQERRQEAEEETDRDRDRRAFCFWQSRLPVAMVSHEINMPSSPFPSAHRMNSITGSHDLNPPHNRNSTSITHSNLETPVSIMEASICLELGWHS